MAIDATNPAVLGGLTPNNGIGMCDLSIIQNIMDILNGFQAANNIIVDSLTVGGVNGNTLSATDLAAIDQSDNATTVGAVAQPVSGSIACTITKVGALARLDFTFNAARIAVTDGAASGSHGATKIFDFVEQAILFQGGRFNQVSCVEGAALTTGAGDAVYAIGIGSTAISAAADGTLGTGAQVNACGASVSITDSDGTGAGTVVATPAVATAQVDGTDTAADLYLNWSGTAATIDANSTIDITGTASVLCLLAGDD